MPFPPAADNHADHHLDADLDALDAVASIPRLSPARLSLPLTNGAPEVLGRGTFAAVYTALLDHANPVAIKRLTTATSGPDRLPPSRQAALDQHIRHAPLARKTLRREARRLHLLRHVPGVVRMFAFLPPDILVLERLSGGSVRAWLHSSRQTSTSSQSPILPAHSISTLPSPRCILQVVRMIALALAAIHRTGVSHGDIKPDNLLFSEPLTSWEAPISLQTHIKFIDFGLSRRFDPPKAGQARQQNEGDIFGNDNKDANGRDVLSPENCHSANVLGKSNKSNDFHPTFADRLVEPILDADPTENAPNLLTVSNSSELSTASGIRHQQYQLIPALQARGTPAYLSPEAWGGSAALRNRSAAFKSDIYALGMILFELETGLTPWQGMAEWAIFAAVCNQDMRPEWPATSERVPGLRKLAEWCWSVDLRQRPTCEQVAERVSKLLDALNDSEERSRDDEDVSTPVTVGSEAGSDGPDKTAEIVPVQDKSSDEPSSSVIGELNVGGVKIEEKSAEATNFQANTCDQEDSSVPFHQTAVQLLPTILRSCPSGSSSSSTAFSDSIMEPISAPPAAHIPLRNVTPSQLDAAIVQVDSLAQQDTADASYSAPSTSTAIPPTVHYPPSNPPNHSTPDEAPPRSGAGTDDQSAESHGYDPDSLSHSQDMSATINPPGDLDDRADPATFMRRPEPVSRNRSNSRGVVRSQQYYISERSPIRGGTLPDEAGQPDATHEIPDSVRSLDYAFKSYVLNDDCEGLCTILRENDRNPKVATQVLEALGVLLERSQSHCKLVASNGTIHLFATILSLYGSEDARLCKAACIAILRLAASNNSIVEKNLHISGSCGLVLSCMRWHPAHLPIIQLGASALNSLCRMSNSLCSVLIAVDGASFALRAIARACNTFDHDIPIASLGLEILTTMARNTPQTIVPRNIISGAFMYCDAFDHNRIDKRFVELIHVVVTRSSRGRDSVVKTQDCMTVISRLVDRSRGASNGVHLLKLVCEIIIEVASTPIRTEVTSAFLNSDVVEAVVQSLGTLAQGDSDAEVAVAAKGLQCLRSMSGLGRDVCGSLQMANVFDLTRSLTERVPHDREIAMQASLLLVSVLREVGGSYYVSNIDAVFRMLVDMQEKWRMDTKILDTLREAIVQIGEVSGPQSSGNNARPLRDSSDSQYSSLKVFIRRKPPH